MPYFEQNARTGAGHLGIDLVGRDLEDRLIFFDTLTDLFQPFRNGSLGDRLTHLRHHDFNDHKLSENQISIE